MKRLAAVGCLMLSGCAMSPDQEREIADCNAISDAARRHACLQNLIAADEAADANGGIGPPSCHPASLRPDGQREDDPC